MFDALQDALPGVSLAQAATSGAVDAVGVTRDCCGDHLQRLMDGQQP